MKAFNFFGEVFIAAEDLSDAVEFYQDQYHHSDFDLADVREMSETDLITNELYSEFEECAENKTPAVFWDLGWGERIEYDDDDEDYEDEEEPETEEEES